MAKIYNLNNPPILRRLKLFRLKQQHLNSEIFEHARLILTSWDALHTLRCKLSLSTFILSLN